MERSKLRVEPLGPEDAADYARLLPAGEAALLASRPVEAIGCRYGGVPCGVLVMQATPQGANLRYLFVDGRIRRRGVGGILLSTAAISCRQRGLNALLASYVPAQFYRDGPGAFLRRFGFVPKSEAEKSCYLVPLAAAATSPIMAGFNPTAAEAGIVPLGSLPPEALPAYTAETGRAIPKHTTPAHAVGQLLEDCSFAALRDDRVVASALFTKMDGETVLEAVYTRDARYAGRLLAVLRRGVCALAEKYPGGRLRIVAALPETQRLAEKLLEDTMYVRQDLLTLRYELGQKNHKEPPHYTA